MINPDAIAKLFCLAETAIIPAAGWQTMLLGDRFLTYGPLLPLQEVEVDGEDGVLLGWPIGTNKDGTYSRESLGQIGGRWVLLTKSSVLPDPLASYSVVYSAEHKITAASPVIIPDRLLTPDVELNAALELPSSDHWYPFGLTPWTNLSRLLPSHELDLATYTVTRQESRKTKQDDERSLVSVSENMRQSVATLAKTHPITVLMTAGHDSRILLAATKGQPDVNLLTFTHNRSLDVMIAKKLGKLVGLDHQTMEVTRDRAEEHIWFEVVGRCVAGASLASAAVKLSLPADRRYLKGIGGEIGRRTNYYRPGDETLRGISPAEIIRRIHLPEHKRLLEAAQAWLDELSEYNDVSELVEVLYRENRIGAWASPQLHGDSIRADWIFPLNQQKTIDSLRFLSSETKNAKISPRIIIGHLWAELLTIPVNPLPLKSKLRRLARTIFNHIFGRLRNAQPRK